MVAHYFHDEGNGYYGSTSPNNRAQRRAALERSLQAWRSHFGSCRELDFNRRVYDVSEGELDSLDILILVYQDRHLLDDALMARCGATHQTVAIDNPRMLPFGAHALIRSHLNDYDWFIYAEDDVAPTDPAMFRKQLLFQRHFGSHRLLQPNRFEANHVNYGPKTYIDGDLAPGMVEHIWQYVAEPTPRLTLDTELGPIRFERARNPNCGFFMLTRQQAAHWVAQPHFLDLDCSFVSPLESAANLGLLKTFSLYKSAADTRWFLEIEHLDQKFASFTWPEHRRQREAEPLLDRVDAN